MVEERLNLEAEVQAIFLHIDEGRNFLLSGGAGSGKTYSLVQVIKQVLNENPSARVACMTYTNAAVKEIEERVNHNNLSVTTIHDFLWDNIKHFQKELKLALIGILNDAENTRYSIEGLEEVTNDFFDRLEKGIQYKEYLKLRDGIISHDEVILLAGILFANYPKLSDVVKDKYGFVFIDEYQDTNRTVIEIFLDSFNQSEKRCIIGFFGDAMQSIYQDGVGNIDEWKGNELGQVVEVRKEQNRRNPERIIRLANQIRTDGLVQAPSADLNAPNMQNGNIKQGEIVFIYSNNEDVGNVRNFLIQNHGWDFANTKATKELNLTHNLIAEKAGFKNLMDIYDKDQIIAYKKRIKDYIKSNGIQIDFTENTFGEVINVLSEGRTVAELRAIKPTAGMQRFIDDNQNLFNIALAENYMMFSKLYFDKDQLLDDKKSSEDDENKKGSKRDRLIQHLFKIQNNIALYTNRDFNEFLRRTDYLDRIHSIEDKITLRENIESLISVGEKTIEEIIIEANESGICIIGEQLTAFIESNKYLYDRVKTVRYSEFQLLYKYLEGKTPFSTQHKTKGAEYDNVLVILDNGGWNNYNFENLFLSNGSESVLSRTQKIFYVCCTRAKEKLVIFYHQPNPKVIDRAKALFGDDSVISI